MAPTARASASPTATGFRKRIALTFDDGPNPATTPKVIEVLKAHHAPADVLQQRRALRHAGAKDLAAQIAADPDYILANHSQHHLNLAQQTAAEGRERDRPHRRADPRRRRDPEVLPVPVRQLDLQLDEAGPRRGYIVTGWHIDSADWCYAAGGGVCKKSTFKYVPDEMRGDMKRLRAVAGPARPTAASSCSTTSTSRPPITSTRS